MRRFRAVAVAMLLSAFPVACGGGTAGDGPAETASEASADEADVPAANADALPAEAVDVAPGDPAEAANDAPAETTTDAAPDPADSVGDPAGDPGADAVPGDVPHPDDRPDAPGPDDDADAGGTGTDADAATADGTGGAEEDSDSGSVDAAAEPDDTPADASGPALVLTAPADGDRAVVGGIVHFAGRTTCTGADVTFVADGKYPFATLHDVAGDFSTDCSFNTAGADRVVNVTVAGADACSGQATVHLAVQPPFSIRAEDRTDANGAAFTVRIAAFPTADPATDLAVVGSSAAATVRSFARGHLSDGASAAVNGAYFAAGSGPVSYGKGHLGYESPSGNVKGPRACLAWDRKARRARVVQSMGRSWSNGAWADGQFPDDADVVCAGPQLLAGGTNVVAAHLASEDFGSSGIQPGSPDPRTAACVTADGSVLLVAAQSDAAKARGFTLDGLAAYLGTLGCVDALNLDGGGSTAFWSAGPPESYDPGTEDRAVCLAVLLLRP